MHTEPIPRPCRTSDEEDAEFQSVVLTHLLLAAPAQLTVDELLRELTNDPDEHDSIVRAVRDLSRAGLLHRHDDFVFPTRAAAHQGALPQP